MAGIADPELPEFAEFWAGAARGALRVQWCTSCTAHQWPPRPFCRRCTGEVEWVDVAGRGRVYSWTVVHVSPLSGFAELTPYAVVIAVLPHASGVRVVARFDGDPGELALDAEVDMVFEKVTDTVSVPLWRLPDGGGA